MGEATAANRSGFSEDGRRYVLRDLHLIPRADSDLWNDRMYLQIDQRGRCNAYFVQPNYTRYCEPLRCFYLRDDESGAFWSAPYEPVQAEPEDFEYSPGLADVRWRVVRDGIELTLQLVVPREDPCELWRVQVRNVSSRPRRVSLYSLLPVGSVGQLAHQAGWEAGLNAFVHEYFPYYVRWQDYDKLRRLANLVVAAPDPTPDSVEANLEGFTGGRGLHDPAQLHQPRLGGGEAMQEPSAAVMQFTRQLEPEGEFVVTLVQGPAHDRDEIARLRRTYLGEGGFTRALEEAEAFLAGHAPSVRVELPDTDLQHYLNHWQPRRALMIGRTLRFQPSPQGRNAIQDMLGLMYTDVASGREWIPRIWAHQRADGWLPHGMTMFEGGDEMPIGTIPHRDTNVWGPMVLSTWVAETGDAAILDVPVPFKESDETASLYEHICRGLEWLLVDRTERGLSRLGQGDWNDPLNMAGKADRGESVWLTEALACALDVWADVAERRGDAERAGRYRQEAEAGRQAVNELAWDGKWYARGTTDDGRWFGTPAWETGGHIFLNAQSWAIFCGAARGERMEACIRAIEEQLMTPSGPMMLAPPFEAMDERIGKLTHKVKGTGENGSVYCHAVTFYAYALYRARRPREAYRILRNLLTGTAANPIGRSGQLPLYVPNYYRGAAIGATAGESSHSPNTGTSAWFYLTSISMLLGVRAQWEGLRIDPQLPPEWPAARVWRRWRDAEFDIRITRGDAAATQVRLNGQTVRDGLIPVQEPGSTHRVEVTIGQS